MTKETVTCFYCEQEGLWWRERRHMKPELVNADGTYHRCDPKIIHAKAIEKIRLGVTVVCKFCLKDGFAWSLQPKRGYRLVDIEGKVHVCEQVRAAGIRRKRENKLGRGVER